MSRRLPLLAALILAAATVALVIHGGPPGGDFANYWTAARLWAEGADLSRLYEYRWFTDMAARDFPGRLVGFPVLTPPSVLFVAPLLPLGPELAGRVWWAGQGLLLLATGLMSARAARLPAWAGLLAILACWPSVLSHLAQGQFHLPAAALVAGGLWAWDRGREGTAGGAWALAAGLKVFAWPLLLLTAAARRWRATAVGAGVLAVGATGSLLLVDLPAHMAWLSDIAGPSARGWFMDPWSPYFQSFGAAARATWLPHPGLHPSEGEASPHLARAVPAFLAALLPLLPAALVGDEQGRGDRFARLAAAASIAALASGPVLARYGLLLLVPPTLYGAAAAWRQGGRLRAGLVLLAALGAVHLPVSPEWSRFPFLDVPRAWACLFLFLLLLPAPTRWRQGARLFAVVGFALGTAWMARPPADPGDGAVAADHPDLPLMAADLVVDTDGTLRFAGLRGDRDGHAGTGWMGFAWDPDDGAAPRIVASDPTHHVWRPTPDGAYTVGPNGAERGPVPCDGATLEVRDDDVWWVGESGAQRLTRHPGRDDFPACDLGRRRVWFLSDRGAGTQALRPWWVPMP